MSKRIKKSPHGLARVFLRVNANNLAGLNMDDFPLLKGVGLISMKGWVEPRVAEAILQAALKSPGVK